CRSSPTRVGRYRDNLHIYRDRGFPLKATSYFIARDSCTAPPEAIDTLKGAKSSLKLPRVFQASFETMVIPGQCRPVTQ
ncbi:unnamed protein product, partial [Hymenolepis diminuta]